MNQPVSAMFHLNMTTDTPPTILRFVGLLLAFALLGSRGMARPAVPEPQPADTGRHLVGAIHCPLWNDGNRWQSLAAFPDREPLLGFYNEGDRNKP